MPLLGEPHPARTTSVPGTAFDGTWITSCQRPWGSTGVPPWAIAAPFWRIAASAPGFCAPGGGGHGLDPNETVSVWPGLTCCGVTLKDPPFCCGGWVCGDCVGGGPVGGVAVGGGRVGAVAVERAVVGGAGTAFVGGGTATMPRS